MPRSALPGARLLSGVQRDGRQFGVRLAALEPSGNTAGGGRAPRQIRRTALPRTGPAEPPPTFTPAGFKLSPKQSEEESKACPSAGESGAPALSQARPRWWPIGAAVKAPPAPCRPSGQRQGRCRRAPWTNNKPRSSRCVCRGVRAGDRQREREKIKGKRNKKRQFLLPFLFDLLLLLLLDLHFSCPLGPPDALLLPRTDVMPVLERKSTAPRCFPPAEFLLFLEAAFIARWVGLAARRGPESRRAVVPPPRRAGSGRDDARGRWRRLCRPAAHFLHLCELLGTGRFEANGAGVGGRGGRICCCKVSRSPIAPAALL